MAKTEVGMQPRLCWLLQVCLVLGACMRPGYAISTPAGSNDGAGTKASRSFKITLGTRETRTERIVPRGAEVQLMCLLSNNGLLGWYKENDRLSANRLLILKAVQPRDAGVYSCQAHGSETANLTLKIQDSGTEPTEEGDIADFSKVEDEAEARLRIEPVDVDSGESVEEEVGTGVTTSNSTALKIVHLPNYGLPLFLQSHKLIGSVQRPLGGFVQLSCPALGNPLPSITWLHNNAKLAPSSARFRVKKWALLIERLTPSDTGLYTCKICNKFGCITHDTHLTVSSASQANKPVIVENTLANQTVAANGSAEFECHVASQTPAQIRWFKYQRSQASNVPLKPAELPLNFTNNPYIVELEISEDQPQLLRIERVRPEDAGWYTCVAMNSVGQAMASAYLMIVEPKSTAWTKQKISPTPALESVISELKSSTIETKTQESASKRPIVGVELEGNYGLDTADNQTLDLDTVVSAPAKPKYGKLSPKSNITNDSDADTELDGENKESIDTADGEEESPPKFKRADKLINSIHKPAGSSIQLMCPAIGNPIPNITWTRNNTEILRHIGKVVYKKWSMQMDDVIAEDSGAYKCSICNKLGCIEHTVKLMIKDRLRSRPIHSDKFPQNQTVLTNSSTHFECRVVSDLEPHIFWVKYIYKNDSIANLERLVVNTPQASPKDYVKLPGDPDKPHILSLENVTHADEGWYTCVAANMLGESMASAYLRVVDKLPTREVYMLWRSHPIWMTVAAIVIVLLFLFGSIFIIYVLRKLKHEKLLKHRIETVHQWTKKVIIYKPPSSEGNSCDLQMPVIKIEKQRTTFQASSMDPSQAFNEYEFPLDSNWEIPRTQLTLGSTLGEGAFGRVVMAEACGLPRTANNTCSIVAVKMVKEEHTDADMASLVREMEVMKMIGKHINIINLLGCCSQSGPLWVIVEFAPHGNLKDFLKKNRPLFVGSPTLQRNSSCLEDKPQLTEKNLISFAFQIARGMEYLASRRCIHRDLAARNVLVSDDYVMKIADFGLARDIQDTDYYRKNTNGRLPIKWMAPESLQEKFYDSQSDVWSFGVLLWEIMTYGEQPYPNIMSAEELYSYLITGQRMEKPPRCSLNIYMLMRQCWHFDSNVRPTFVEIVENLDKILQLASNSSNAEYLDLSMPMLETPPSSSDDESEPETFQETSPLRYQYTYKFN